MKTFRTIDRLQEQGRAALLLYHKPTHRTVLLSWFPLSLLPSRPCSCGQEEPTYSALWGDNKAFDQVIISPAMLNEHLPHMVMEGLNKVRVFSIRLRAMGLPAVSALSISTAGRRAPLRLFIQGCLLRYLLSSVKPLASC